MKLVTLLFSLGAATMSVSAVASSYYTKCSSPDGFIKFNPQDYGKELEIVTELEWSTKKTTSVFVDAEEVNADVVLETELPEIKKESTCHSSFSVILYKFSKKDGSKLPEAYSAPLQTEKSITAYLLCETVVCSHPAF